MKTPPILSDKNKQVALAFKLGMPIQYKSAESEWHTLVPWPDMSSIETVLAYNKTLKFRIKPDETNAPD